ncbi:MAG: TlpA family protein disulfide reductase [Bacteroidia bacterium]|nr:TlpA family protein disulfide reductase [Bacteroidia bacterium]MBT8279748.1 TlpA family protein disulfide reductase [Bacteroidia bacterium]NNK59242.1 TlpA family protein disulfide reductase [Flavobacteriaceae bacterium]NNL32920.1 TlpA family protein disulfide reductase [Flavobacteriaceae bacterium]RZW52603.1 MAG: TlpA family protein disulfide reductase [Flavobacteriaceae bacterium]
MKRWIYIFSIFMLMNCSFEKPTLFSEEALNDTFKELDGNEIIFQQILDKHEGKTILIDVWASWCADCITGIPTVKTLQQEFPEVVFLFLSEDRTEAAWKRAIEKYKIEGEHYYMITGHDGPFGEFLNSNWIPRYMVIDKNGNIKLFKAKSAKDKRIKEALK